MERLTQRDEFGNAEIIGVNSMKIEYDVGSDDYSKITDVIVKLAEYEDLEEQGKLLQLPCKVGDTVWYINERLEKQGRKKVTRFLVDNGSVDHITLGGVMIPQIEVCNNKENSWITFDYKDDWNKIVFLTKEEAEVALKKYGQLDSMEEHMGRVLPILFNTEMVRAILRKLSPKTTTRRCIKGYIPEDAVWGYTMFTPKGHISCRGTFSGEHGEKFFKLPCQKGDILYVRETWNFVYDVGEDDQPIEGTGRYIYYADNPMPFSHWVDNDTGEHKDKMPWHPSIHMPKDAARIWIRVNDVRVERLKDMKTRDYIAEGAKDRYDFIRIWDSTAKNKEYGWYANPWVWVIEFEQCEKPEPCILAGIEPAEDKRPCIGYSRDENDDEPCEMCKGCP